MAVVLKFVSKTFCPLLINMVRNQPFSMSVNGGQRRILHAYENKKVYVYLVNLNILISTSLFSYNTYFNFENMFTILSLIFNAVISKLDSASL